MSTKVRIFTRVLALVCFLVVVISITYASFSLKHHREHVLQSVLNRGSILAEEIERLMLWDDRVAIRRMLESFTGEDCTVYAFVEESGQNYVGTFTDGPPKALLDRKIPEMSSLDIWMFRNESNEILQDVMLPIAGKGLSLHIGVSRTAVDRQILSQLLWTTGLAIFTLFVGVLLAAWIARWTTREVDRMTVSRDYLRAIIDGIPESIIVVKPDFEVVLANRLARQLSSQSGGNPSSLKCYEILHDRNKPCSQEDGLCPLQEVFKRGVPVTVEHTHHDAQGHEVPYEIVAAPILNDKGEVISVIESSRDLTERQMLETQLRQAQKMEAVGQLAGGIAHDFNNLLQAIQGYTSLTLSDLSPAERHYNNLKQVESAAKRAADLIRQLLAFSRRQVLQLVDLDLNQAIKNVSEMIRPLLGENIEVRFIPGYKLGSIHADPNQVEQVLINLCVNARDAMPRGGKLTIETQNILLNNDYCLSHPGTKEGHYVLLTVSDTGQGMDEEVLDQIFEPFFTTKEIGRGTGLGLATVYGIVKQHEGFIYTYSELNKGTIFKIYLPCVERVADALPHDLHEPVRGGAETILLAEDSEPVRNLAKSILEKAGYTVLAAEDGTTAIRIFKARQHEIDMLLLDVIMPGMDGRAVFEEVRKENSQIPILFASGYSADSIHTNFILNNGMSLIEKPYQPDALRRKVREILDLAVCREPVVNMSEMK